jgi:hypothetical protein
MPNAKTRKYIYGIVGSLTPLLVTLGVINGDVAGHVMAVAASVLALGGHALAYQNVQGD